MRTADGSPHQKTDRELRIKAEMLTCRHFNGVQHDACRAGVNYRALAGEPALGCMTRIPCLPGFDPKGGPLVECSKLARPTADEAAQTVDEGEAAMARHMRAFRAVHDDAKAKGFKKRHGGESEMACPLCGGVLRYSVASYNGHVLEEESPEDVAREFAEAGAEVHFLDVSAGVPRVAPQKEK